MKFTYVAIGALVALIPMASFALIGLEVVMIYQIAKSRDAVSVSDLAWFCARIIAMSFFLKILVAWLHFIPVVGQIANSLVAAGFIYFVYNVAEFHYDSISRNRS